MSINVFLPFSYRQQALFHVLAAYSMYNTEVGYCQGMSQIAALLLMYMNEEVSWVSSIYAFDLLLRNIYFFIFMLNRNDISFNGISSLFYVGCFLGIVVTFKQQETCYAW